MLFVLQKHTVCAVGFGLFLSGTLLELHVAHVHNARDETVNILDFVVREVQHMESFMRQLVLLLVVDTINGQFGLGHKVVILHRLVQQQILFQVRQKARTDLKVYEVKVNPFILSNDLIEDMVATLSGCLTNHTRLLQQIFQLVFHYK